MVANGSRLASISERVPVEEVGAQRDHPVVADHTVDGVLMVDKVAPEGLLLPAGTTVGTG
jgi:hypothetical protein